MNETPTNLTLSYSSISENQAIGTVVGSFMTTDPDTNNTFTYSLVTGTGSTDNNLFTIQNNQLKTNAVFDYETKNSYSIRVKTTDQGGLSFEKAFTISINNLSEPLIKTPISDISVQENAANTTLDLLNYFDDPSTTGKVARFELYNTSLAGGIINVLLFDQQQTGAPLTVQNFLNYVNDGDYTNTFIHRSVPGFIIQGGGYTVTNNTSPFTVSNVIQDPAVQNEFSLQRSNVRGTIAMAKLGNDPNSATNQWFFNLDNNAANLDNQNSGFTAFGQVLSQADLGVIDAIATVPIYPFQSPFNSIPLTITNTSQLDSPDDFVRFKSVTVSTVNELTFSVVSNSNPNLVNASITNNQLTLDYLDNQTGSANIRIRGTSLLGYTVEDTFTVTVAPNNQAPTNLTISNSNVAENQAIGTVIGDLSTIDPDSESTFTYSLVSGTGSTDNNLFTISGNQLKINASFDYETKNSYSILVKTTDQDGLSFEKLLTINITNVNETPNNFQYNLSATTYTPAQTLNLTGSVIDPDGAIDLSKIDWWVKPANGNWVNISDTTSFTPDSNNNQKGNFNYQLSLQGYTAGNYTFWGQAYDKQGAKSAAITKTFTVNQTPNNFQYNLSATTYTPTQNLNITGSVIDPDGAIDLSKIDWWVKKPNGNWVNLTDTTSFTPAANNNQQGNFNYQLSLPGYQAGNYTFWGQVYDKQGAKSAAITKTFTVNQTPNNFQYNLSATTYTPTQNLNITGSVIDPDGATDLSTIDWWVKKPDGTWINLADTTSFTADSNNNQKGNFNYQLSLQNYPAGSYSFWGQAYDKQGAKSAAITKTFTVNQTPNNFQYNLSATTYTPAQNLNITGSVIDPDGATDLSKIDWWVKQPNGNWVNISDTTSFTPDSNNNQKGNFSYQLSLQGYQAGSYTFWGQAYDKQGAKSAAITKTFTVNQTPNNFQYNLSATTYTPTQNLNITGSVIDPDGATDLSKIDWWVKQPNGNWVNISDTTSFTPDSNNNQKGNFSYQLSLQGYQAGSYTFWGQAYDKQGAKSNAVTKNFDVITGLSANATVARINQVDKLTGTNQADTFILGDASKGLALLNPYYAQAGVNDYALITNFETSRDKIQLQGSKSDYQLGASPQGLPQGTAIYLNNSQQSELLAIVQDVFNLNIDSNSFSFV